MPSPIFSNVSRADLVASAGSVVRGEIKLDAEKDSREYHRGRTGRGSIIPAHSIHGVDLKKIKESLVVIDVDEEVEEVKDPDGNIIDRVTHTSTKVYQAGAPDNPYNGVKPRETTKETICQTPKTAETQPEHQELVRQLLPGLILPSLEFAQWGLPSASEMSERKTTDTPRPESPSQLRGSESPPSPSSSDDSAAHRLLTQQLGMLWQALQTMQTGFSQSLMSMGSLIPQLVQQEMGDRRPDQSAEGSVSVRPTSETRLGYPRPNPLDSEERQMLRVEWSTQMGTMTCPAEFAGQVDDSGLVIVIYDADQDSMICPAKSEVPLVLTLGTGQDRQSLKVMAFGLDFQLELDGKRRKFVVLRRVE